MGDDYPHQPQHDGPGGKETGLEACIGSLEHHIHKVFASVRVPGEDFVYTPSSDLYRELDAYCDHRTISEVKAPFLVKGESGSGKSALLANWLRRRQRMGSRARAENEFVFWHAVGCSRQSLNINSLLRRLMLELKSRFELSREMPSNQERLSWELPRFLDAAARRGKVIVVIDGLHRIANNDESEANLAWLPLELPPGVRFIVSATVYPHLEAKMAAAVQPVAAVSGAGMHRASSRSPLEQSRSPSPTNAEADAALPRRTSREQLAEKLHQLHVGAGGGGGGGSSGQGYHQPPDVDGDDDKLGNAKNFRGRRIMAELQRRQLTGLRMQPMDRPTCRTLVEAYIRKSVQAAVAATHAAKGTSASATAMQTFLTTMNGHGAHADMIMGGDLDGEVESFFSAYGGGDVDAAAGGGHVPAAMTSAEAESVPGLLLFESQIEALLNHSHGSTPMFLRLILRCAHNAVARGFSLWRIWDDWLQARSMIDLVERILRSLEMGHAPTPQTMREDEERTVREGGLAALAQLYPWHPSLGRMHRRAQEAAALAKQAQHGHGAAAAAGAAATTSSSSAAAAAAALDVGTDSQDDTAELAKLIAMSKPPPPSDGHDETPSGSVGASSTLHAAAGLPPLTLPDSMVSSANVSLALSGQAAHFGAPSQATLVSGGTAGAHMGMGVTKGAGTSILQSLGDQQWLSAAQHAENKLDEALRAAEKGVDRALQTAKRSAAAGGGGGGAAVVAGSVAFKERGSVDSQQSSTGGGSHGGGGGGAYIDVMMGTVLANASVQMALAPSTPAAAKDGSSPSPVNKSLLLQSIDAGTRTAVDSPMTAKDSGTHSPLRPITPRTTRIHTLRDATAINVEQLLIEAKLKEDEENYVEPEDPVEVAKVGLSSLPVYLRGGLQSQGLGALLGNALSLLFVARHGLKEAELWAMLATLRARPPEYLEMLHRQRVTNEAARAVLQVCYHVRNDLEDHWRVEDQLRTGMLSLAQLQRGMLKSSPELRRGDLMRLLQITGLMAQEAINGGFVTGRTGAATTTVPPSTTDTAGDAGADAAEAAAIRVYFPELLHRIVTGEKRERWHAQRRHLGLKHEHEHIGLGGIVNDGPKVMGAQEDFHVARSPVAARHAAPSPVAAQSPSSKPFAERDQRDAASTLGEDVASLGPVIEENLLELLTSLGALHSTEHQVILLPSENHSFRTVIRTIVEQRGGEEAWHGHMIRYFQRLPTSSMRRCEELPWHLQLCRKWHVLKDALADLKTFDMMYTSDDLRDELLSYWRLLTEGPLLVLSEEQVQAQVDAQLDALEKDKEERIARQVAQAQAALAAARGRRKAQAAMVPSSRPSSARSGALSDSDFSFGQFDGDTRSQQGKNGPADPLEELGVDTNDDAHEARRRAAILSSVSNEVGPFDIVEEFNRTLEAWVMGQSAPASAIPGAAEINAMVLHIGQFIAEFSVRGDPPPPFVRPSLSLDGMATFKVGFTSVHELLLPDATAGEGKDEEETSPKRTVGVKVKPVVPMFPTAQMVNSRLYLYLRWIWTQFPWLAMAHAAVAVPGPTLAASAGPGSRLGSAFGAAAFGLGSTTDGSLSDTNGGGFPVTEGGVDGAGRRGGATTGTGKGDKSRRFWEVKKADPTVPLFEYTLPKRQAALNTVLTPASYVKTLEVVVQRVRDDIKNEIQDPDNRLVPVSEHIDVCVKRLPRFRRTLEQDGEANKDVLYARHSLKTEKNGTMFPSIEAQRRAQHRALEEAQPDLYEVANMVKRRGGQSDPFGPTIEEEIRQLRDAEALRDYNGKRGYPIPVTNEAEVYYEKECIRAEKLRRLMDRVSAKLQERRALLATLRQRVRTRDQHDEEVAADIMAGDAAIESLETRLREMARAHEDARALGRGFEALIELLKEYPPNTEMHMRAQEQALALARQQLADLTTHHRSTLAESENVEAHRKGHVLEKIAYYRNARQELRKKLYTLYRDSMDRKQPIEAPPKGGMLYRFYKKVKKRLLIRKRAIRAKKRATLAQKFMQLQVEKSKAAAAAASQSTRSDGSVVANGGGKSFAAPMIVSRRSFMPSTAGVASSFGSTGGHVPPDATGVGADGKLFATDRFLPVSVVAIAENLTKQRGGNVVSAIAPETALSPQAQGMTADAATAAQARAGGKGSSGPDEQARRRALLKSHRERQGLPQPDVSPDPRDRRASIVQQEVLSSSSSESEDSSEGEGEDDFDGYGGARRGSSVHARENGGVDDEDHEHQERDRRQSLQIAHSVLAATTRADGRRRRKKRGDKYDEDEARRTSKQQDISKFVGMFKSGAESALRRTRLNASFSGAGHDALHVSADARVMTAVATMKREASDPAMRVVKDEYERKRQQELNDEEEAAAQQAAQKSTAHALENRPTRSRSRTGKDMAAFREEATANVQHKKALDKVFEAMDPKLKKKRLEEEAHSVQMKMMVEYVLERTKSVSDDEFLERFKAANKLTDSLRGSQIQADAKCLSLKAQLVDLQRAWEEMAVLEADFVAQRRHGADGAASTASGSSSSTAAGEAANEEKGSSSSPTSRGAGRSAGGDGGEAAAEGAGGAAAADGVEGEGRHLDEAIYAAEMRLQHAKRRLDQASQLINEIRLGVTTIVTLLDANEKVLVNLPRTQHPPPMASDQDVAASLTWCEERVTAMSEAMVLDTGGGKAAAAAQGGGKDGDGGEKETLFQRQVQLAKLVHKMVKHSSTQEEAAYRVLSNKKKLKTAKDQQSTNTGMQRLLIDLNDKNTVINSPRAVVVANEYEHEHQYNVSVSKYAEQATRRAEQYEDQMALKREAEALGDSHVVERFLREALAGSYESTTALRKANFLAKKPIKGGLGFALEDLFASHGRGTELQGLTGNVMPHLETVTRTPAQIERDRVRGRGGPKANRSSRTGGGVGNAARNMSGKGSGKKGKRGGTAGLDDDEASDEASLSTEGLGALNLTGMSDNARNILNVVVARTATAGASGGGVGSAGDLSPDGRRSPDKKASFLAADMKKGSVARLV